MEGGEQRESELFVIATSEDGDESSRHVCTTGSVFFCHVSRQLSGELYTNVYYFGEKLNRKWNIKGVDAHE